MAVSMRASAHRVTNASESRSNLADDFCESPRQEQARRNELANACCVLDMRYGPRRSCQKPPRRFCVRSCRFAISSPRRSSWPTSARIAAVEAYRLKRGQRGFKHTTSHIDRRIRVYFRNFQCRQPSKVRRRLLRTIAVRRLPAQR